MLQRIQINNYAIIDSLDIDFSQRLNVITGETGAGKSILMGALSLILGDRADTAVLLQRDKKCVVEGVFSLEKGPGGAKVLTEEEQGTTLREGSGQGTMPGRSSGALAFFQADDLDITDNEITIRREIAPSGKSRAFVNDTPVNLEQLRKLSSLLVDLHRQFDTLELGESDFQREVLDALAGQAAALKAYQAGYRDWQVASRELTALRDQQAKFTKEFDYHKFLYDELHEAGLKDNELEELDQELKLLNNSEGIKTALSKISYDLQEGEQPLVQQLRTLGHLLANFSGYHVELAVLSERMSSVQIELQDIAGEVERINEEVNYDPKRIETINERLSMGYKLMKKHGVQTTAALLEIRAQLEHKLQNSLQVEAGIAAGEKAAQRLLQEAKKRAAVLSKGRQAEIAPLETQVNKLLKQVGMPNARLKVELREAELDASGMDSIEFLFDANKSNRFEPIRKVASGGELSRLMLCIKSLVAESVDPATLIFDEIDTGISGEAAKQVGIILKNLASKRQVICITHQPQIAGKADAHYFVYKAVKGESLQTNIRLLNQEERITAIAQMLSGERPTAAALENAREMVLS